jgi:hypothetical protein
MTSNLLGTTLDGVLESVLDGDPDDLLVVNPSAETVEDLVGAATEYDGELPAVRVLAAEDVLKDVMDDFLVASRAADLVSNGLSLRGASSLPRHSLLVTPETVVALVAVGDGVAGIAADDEAFVGEVRTAYETDWEAAEPYSLRTPPITDVRETLAADIGPDALSDFDGVLASLETARGNGDGLDEVTVSLLVAAKNQVLLYDISKWGEDVGIASKATFSRTKTRLEDLGLIDTEKVPIDVGRPRLRLQLSDERLRDADASELANVASSILAS